MRVARALAATAARRRWAASSSGGHWLSSASASSSKNSGVHTSALPGGGSVAKYAGRSSVYVSATRSTHSFSAAASGSVLSVPRSSAKRAGMATISSPAAMSSSAITPRSPSKSAGATLCSRVSRAQNSGGSVLSVIQARRSLYSGLSSRWPCRAKVARDSNANIQNGASSHESANSSPTQRFRPFSGIWLASV